MMLYIKSGVLLGADILKPLTSLSLSRDGSIPGYGLPPENKLSSIPRNKGFLMVHVGFKV